MSLSPEVRAARRAYQNTHAAKTKAGKALRALSPALMQRAVALALKHAATAGAIHRKAGSAHPDAPTLKSLAHTTAAAYAAVRSLEATLEAALVVAAAQQDTNTPNKEPTK